MRRRNRPLALALLALLAVGIGAVAALGTVRSAGSTDMAALPLSTSPADMAV